ncbi:MAG TPA: AI-2E family transporter [Longimicrobiaceae bacterium]|nr:AI-2E family transporter [Longimicrobiaceae bacterium]
MSDDLRPTYFPPADQPLRPEHLYKAVGLLLLVLFLFTHFDSLARVLLIVYAAAILGVAFNVVVGLMPGERRWMTGLLGVVIFGLTALALWIGLPALASQLRGLTGEIPSYREQLEAWVEQLRAVTGLNIDLFGQESRDFFGNLFSDAAVLGTARGLIEGIFLPFVLIMGGLYAAGKPNDKLLVGLIRIVPPDRRDSFRRMLRLLGDRLKAWVKGTLLSMLIVSVLAGMGLWLIGAPYPLLLGVLAGLAEIVPIIGPWVAGALAVGVTFLHDPTTALWVALLMLAVQQVESNLITPIVMASVAEVHPFVTLFAIILFATLFGFLGILLSLPLVLLVWTVVEVLWVERALGANDDSVEPVARE